MKCKWLSPLAAIVLIAGFLAVRPSAALAFNHPGLWLCQSDLDRMRTKYLAGAQPWKQTGDNLIASASKTQSSGATTQITNSYSMQDGGNNILKLAIAWVLTGDITYGNAARDKLNEWSVYQNGGDGLREGLGGAALCNAAEIIRYCSVNGVKVSWSSSDIAAFQSMLLNHLAPLLHGYGDGGWGTPSINGMICIAVFCDSSSLYNEAVNVFKYGPHTVDSNTLVMCGVQEMLDPTGQSYDSGRDQPHAQFLVGHLFQTAIVAWNQGTDLFTFGNNRLLMGMEYGAKYNLGNTVPYRVMPHGSGWDGWGPAISTINRGQFYQQYEEAVAFYQGVLGMSAPYSLQVIASSGYYPEGNSTDCFGYGGLLYRGKTAIGSMIPGPTGVTASSVGTQTSLKWHLVSGATRYYVKRSTTPNGPYATIDTAYGPGYLDLSVTANTTYYYVVSAVTSSAETGNSAEVVVTVPFLAGTLIGTSGTLGAGNTADKAIDGWPNTYFDAPDASGDWVGLDLGANYQWTVTQIRFCPRSGWANRMVGGVFQGSNTADFSSGVTTLYTINAAPQEGILTSVSLSDPSGYRYVRYIGPAGGYCNVADIQFAGIPTIGGTYKVVNRNSGQILDVTAQGTTNGAQIDQWPYNGSNNQRWSITSLGAGRYTVIGVQSGRSLDISGGSGADGAKVQIWDYAGYANQQFSFVPTDSGYFRIVPDHSNKAIEVYRGSITKGSLVDQWTWNGGAHQQWSLKAP